MDKLNIFNTCGYLTIEQRKQTISHTCNYFRFVSCVDLSIGVKVYPLGFCNEYPIEKYSQDLSVFMCWWTNSILKDLNGFSGFTNVSFQLIDFKLN